jgi:hypothetical protein
MVYKKSKKNKYSKKKSKKSKLSRRKRNINYRKRGGRDINDIKRDISNLKQTIEHLTTEGDDVSIIILELEGLLDELKANQNSLEKESPKMLLYCHPRKVRFNKTTNKIENHWFENIPDYNNFLEKNYGDLVILTVDKDKRGESDFKEDGFSKNFAKKHKEEFDIIHLPDCDGTWAEAQELLDKKDNQLEELVYVQIKELFDILFPMIKPNGVLILHKFINFGDNDAFYKMVVKLIKHEFELDAKPMDLDFLGTIIKGLIIKK